MKRWMATGILSLVAMPVIAIVVLGASGGFYTQQLPVLGQITHFDLIERSGRRVNEQEFKNRVWVVGFLFTHCASQCPTMVAKMQKLQREFRLKPNFRLVAISVDPERDTPEHLREYAQRASADPYKWLFLTGEHTEIQRLAKEDFKLSAIEKVEGDVLHSSKLVLVDGFARVRGYYDTNEESEVKTLIKHVRKTLRETHLD